MGKHGCDIMVHFHCHYSEKTKLVCPLIMSIVRSICQRTELQFQIHQEGWQIRIAREAEGLESYSDLPAFSMDFKLFQGARENRPTNNNFVYQGARHTNKFVNSTG